MRKNDADRVTVIGAGVTLHEALAAADELAKQGNGAGGVVLLAANSMGCSGS